MLLNVLGGLPVKHSSLPPTFSVKFVDLTGLSEEIIMTHQSSKTVLITGATSGIGLELTKIFYDKGHPLVLVSRNQDKLTHLRNSFAEPQRIEVIAQDLSAENAATVVYDKCKEMGLEIHILVNNAGMGKMGEHVDLKKKSIQEMIQLNVLSLTMLCALFGEDMKNRGQGYILNVGSVAGFMLAPYMATYIATKHFISSFSISLAKELEDHGVIVRCLCPGTTDTSFFDEAGMEPKFFFSRRFRAPAQLVAQKGYNSLFKKSVFTYPDWKNYFLTVFPRFIPMSCNAWLAKFLMRKSI